MGTLVAGTGLGAETPPRAPFGCSGSQCCLFIEQEKAKETSGISECHLNQPHSGKTGLLLIGPPLPSVTLALLGGIVRQGII